MKNVKSKLLNNLGLKLISVALAIALWFIVINVSDYQMTVHIHDIPVEQKNGDVLESLDQVYDIVSGDTVDIIVKGPRSMVSKLKAEDFVAIADLSKMSITNTVNIDVSAKKVALNDEISIICNDNTMQLSLEDKVEKQFQVIIDTYGTVEEGYALGDCVATPNIITVQGPESVVKKIKEIKTSASVDKENESFEIKEKVNLYDAYGEIITNDKISLSVDEVTGIINIYPTKEVSVVVETVGELADDYYLSEIIYEPQIISIAGEQDEIKKISNIKINDIDISDLTSDYETIIDMTEYLPDGVVLAQSSKDIAITLKIEKIIEKDIKLSSSDITLKNANALNDYSVELGDDVSIKVHAIESVVNTINAKRIKEYIDCKDLKYGTNYVKIQFEDVTGVIKTEIVGTIKVVVKEKTSR